MDNLVNILGYAGVAIFIFLLLREIFTWYWKINKIISLLEKIEKNTRSEIENESLTKSVPENKPVGSVWRDGRWGSK